MKLKNLKHLLCAILTGGTMLFTSCEECEHEGDRSIASSLQVGDIVCSDGSVLSKEKFSSSPKERKHSKKCTFYTLRFGCSFAAVNTIKPQLL